MMHPMKEHHRLPMVIDMNSIPAIVNVQGRAIIDSMQDNRILLIMVVIHIHNRLMFPLRGELVKVKFNRILDLIHSHVHGTMGRGFDPEIVRTTPPIEGEMCALTSKI